MPENDLSLLTGAAKAAGDIATGFWRQSPEIWEKPDAAGPVSEADIAVNNMLQDQLLSKRPDYGWLSEETQDTPDRLPRKRVFIIDPIDGTRSFIAGERTWAHSLAVAEAGEIIAAVIYLPLHDKLYSARPGNGAHLNGVPIRQSGRAEFENARVLSTKPNFDPSFWPNGVPDVQRHFRSSLAYRLALVAEGRFDAMITFRDTWEWDVAAGTLIASEAGATVTDRHRARPRFNNPHPALPGLLVASQGVHNGISASLAQ